MPSPKQDVRSCIVQPWYCDYKHLRMGGHLAFWATSCFMTSCFIPLPLLKVGHWLAGLDTPIGCSAGSVGAWSYWPSVRYLSLLHQVAIEPEL